MNCRFIFRSNWCLKSWCKVGRNKVLKMLLTVVKLTYAFCTSKTPTANTSFISFKFQQKDPDDRLQKLLKIRDDRSEPTGSPYRMDHVCYQIPETVPPFMWYHRDCYRHFTGNFKSSQMFLTDSLIMLNYGCHPNIEIVHNSLQHISWDSPDFFPL